MSREFRNTKSIFWLVSMVVLLTGFIAFALIAPNRTLPGSKGPNVNLPRLEHVPPPSAPPLRLEGE